MLLARAKITSSAGTVIAAQERRRSLLSKGRYRDSEKLAKEAAVGSLNKKDMPKRKDAQTPAQAVQHKANFKQWMQKTLKGKVCEGIRSCRREAGGE